MEAVLTKALSFLAMIAAGILLRRIGLFKDGDDRILSKIILNFTLPAAVVGAFSNFRVDVSLIALVGLGVLMNLLLSGAGYFLARKGSKADKAFGLLNYSGYNIGSFTMPYVQSFLGDAGMAITGLFDTGNALMCTGGTYAIASAMMGEERPSLPSMAKKVFSSVPFDSYLVMFLVSLSGFRLPQVVLTVCGNIASANAFLCMFMVGLMFKIELKGNLGRVLSIVGLRFLLNCLVATLFYFCLPFDEEIRRVLVIASFSPISAMAPVFSMMLGLDKGTAGAANSLSIPLAIATITGLLVLWH